MGLLLIVLGTSALANDAFLVTVGSHEDAEVLSRVGVSPLLRVSGGYLVLCSEERYPDLANSGLEYEFIAADLDRNKLMLDMRTDSANVERYPLVFQDGNLRLYHLDVSEIDRSMDWPGLAPLLTHNVKFLYREPPIFKASLARDLVDLNWLVSQISNDSCQSYMEQLEAFNGRLLGTSSNYASRDWIVSKLLDFGYDSVVTDTFWATNFWESPPVDAVCHNVIAYKIGSVYPEHQIVVGAHRDAYPLSSPGADDNGSGTTAVLEIARALKDIDTKQTFVFCLFDAEEVGIWGAWYYANRAFTDGDSITLVLNLDCISYEGNVDTCMLYGEDGAYAYSQLWTHLADSLALGIHGKLFVERAEWDGVAFDQLGYNTISLGEQIYTWGIHSAHDSTVYCDYDYLTKIARGSLAMLYMASETYAPQPTLLIGFPNGVPSLLFPESSAVFDVTIAGYADGTVSPGTGQLHYAIDGGAYAATTVTPVSGDLYEAMFPPFSNLSRVQYYLTVQESGGAVVYAGDEERPFYAGVAAEETVVFHDNFESPLGWIRLGTAPRGYWVRSHGGGYGYYGQAPTDYDQSGYGYFTGAEQSAWEHDDLDDGMTGLRSPRLEISDGVTLVEYALWYCNSTGNNPYADIFDVRVSTDNGSSFTPVATFGPVAYASGGWFIHQHWVNEHVDPNDSVRLQFEASDFGGDSQVEAALDAVRFIRYSSGPNPLIVTDSLPDWTAMHPYQEQLTHSGGYGEVSWMDADGDLEGTGLALSSDGLTSGVPQDGGQISFTAVATDGVGRTDSKLFLFQINPQLLVDSANLMNPQIGKPYSAQLVAHGGTGARTWLDLDDGLAGSGLVLSSGGLLSGTPPDTVPVSFVAQVTDDVGAIDEKTYDLQIYPQFVCGDVDGDGEGPNIVDLTFFVSFLFGGGDPPSVMAAGDVDGIGGNELNIADLTYLVAFLFEGGPDPICN